MPLSCDRSLVAMEAACLQTAEQMCSRVPRIPHAVAVMVLDLAFYTEDPYSMEDAVNIFIFLDLTPAARSKASLLVRGWGAILG